MSPQLVDLNADGHHDILVGSFEGVPYWIRGGEKGFSKPEQIKDRTGKTVLIAAFWNYETEEWDETDRSGTEGHCTSAAAVDWDADGDLDLLLGDYYGGRLYWRKNEGTAREPAFATVNEPVLAAKKPVVIPKGLAAPRVVDWDGDGLFDILCGGAKGGVYLYRNSGQADAPRFERSQVLIEPQRSGGGLVTKVPVKDGQPSGPGSSFHVEPVDYDGDGDLDLLVGARCSWIAHPPRELTDEEARAAAEIAEKLQQVQQKMIELSSAAQTREERAKLSESEEYQAVQEEYRALYEESQKYDTDPTKIGDFVWLFRRM